MGRRSTKATKSGKFMNPTDQARKEARKKELKKNKKQRQLVRTAVLKNKDPGLIIKELDKLDEVEYNPLVAPALAEKVLKDKRKKLKETLDRVMKLHQKDDPNLWNELKKIESEYERRRFHRIQHYEAVKQAENINNVEDIPLPDLPALGGGDGGLSEIPLPDDAGGIPMPPQSGVHGILKKAPMVVLAPGTPTFQGRDPPGVPAGNPPDLEEMDELSDEEMDQPPERPKLVDDKSKGVRFSDGGSDKPEKKDPEKDKNLSEMDKFMKEVEEEFKSMAEEEDLQPPGTESEEGDLSHSRPEEAAHSDDDDDDHDPLSKSSLPIEDEDDESIAHHPSISTAAKQLDTAALAATAIASASSSSRPPMPPPQHKPPFYPPPPPGMNMPNRLRYPPPLPPPMRPGGFGGGRHGAPYNMPPGGGGPRYRQGGHRSNVFSGAPQIVKSDGKVGSDTTIQAKPQIRSLSADVTRFVPTVVKTRKEEPDRPKKPEYKIGQSHMMHYKEPQPPKPPQQSKDDAYADFMKEMSGLM